MVPKGTALPAYLQGGAPSQNAALVTSAEVHPRISIKGKQFRLIKDGQETVMPMGAEPSMVILGSTPATGTSKAWYAGSYTEGTLESPDCCSADGVRPDAGVPSPQSATCAQCPKNAWGTSTNQDGTLGKGKACSDGKTIFVVNPKDIDGDIYHLRLPPTSHAGKDNKMNLSCYARELDAHNIPFSAALTKLNFSDAASPTLTFKYGGCVDEAAYQQVVARAASAEVQAMIVVPGAAPITSGDAQLSPPDPGGVAMEDPWGAGDSQGASQTDDNTQQTQEPATAGASQEAPDDERILVDMKGNTWDPEFHATTAGGGGVLVKDGTFRKRKGAPAQTAVLTGSGPDAPATPPPNGAGDAQAAAPGSNIEDVLAGW